LIQSSQPVIAEALWKDTATPWAEAYELNGVATIKNTNAIFAKLSKVPDGNFFRVDVSPQLLAAVRT
jgi:hypothetical protein